MARSVSPPELAFPAMSSAPATRSPRPSVSPRPALWDEVEHGVVTTACGARCNVVDTATAAVSGVAIGTPALIQAMDTPLGAQRHMGGMLHDPAFSSTPTSALQGRRHSPAEAASRGAEVLRASVESSSPTPALLVAFPEEANLMQRRQQAKSSPLTAWIEGARVLGERSMSLQDSHWQTAMVCSFVGCRAVQSRPLCRGM